LGKKGEKNTKRKGESPAKHIGKAGELMNFPKSRKGRDTAKDKKWREKKYSAKLPYKAAVTVHEIPKER